MESPSDWELTGRIMLALLLGGAIGLEREISGHPAGMRTHITVALGSALFTMVGAYGFADITDGQLGTFSVDRVASTVVTGIGFLGGGAILKLGATVKGLTTAGSLWVSAALGMGVAVGQYTITLVTAAAAFLSLSALRVPTRWVVRRLAQTRQTVIIHLQPDADPSGVLALLSGLEGVEVRSLALDEGDDGRVLRCELRAAPGHTLEASVGHLEALDEVTGLDVIR